MMRLRLPSLLFNNAIIATATDTEKSLGFKARFSEKMKGGLPFKTQPDWTLFDQQFANIPTKELQNYIINTSFNRGTQEMVNSMRKSIKREYCIQLMSLPEYQMC